MVVISVIIIILGFLAVLSRNKRDKELSEEYKLKLLKDEYLYVIGMLTLFIFMIVVAWLTVYKSGETVVIISLFFWAISMCLVGSVLGLLKQFKRLGVKKLEVIEVVEETE